MIASLGHPVTKGAHGRGVGAAAANHGRRVAWCPL